MTQDVEKPNKRNIEKLFRELSGYNNPIDEACPSKKQLDDADKRVDDMDKTFRESYQYVRACKTRERLQDKYNAERKAIQERWLALRRLYFARGLTPAVLKKIADFIDFLNRARQLMTGAHDMQQVVFHGEHVSVCRTCKKQPSDPTFADGCAGPPAAAVDAAPNGGGRMGAPVLAELADRIAVGTGTAPRAAQPLDADAIEDEIARHEGEIARLKVLLKRAQAKRRVSE